MASHKIKVVYIITSLGIGGAEKILLTTIRNLNHMLFSIYVISLYNQNALLNEYKRHCEKVYFLKYRNKYNPFIIIKIYKIIKLIKPDVVHTHMPHATIWGRIAALLAGTKIIMTTEHNISVWRKSNFLFWFFYWLTALFTDKIITVSQAIKKQLINTLFISPQKIEVIYNGINIDEFVMEIKAPSDLLSISHPIIGTIGRLHKIKGHAVLIESMRFVKKQFPQGNLIIIGDGEEKMKLQRLVRKYALSNSVHFLGTRNDLLGYLKLMDIFVFPSLEEGLGLALIEACAAGKPCIASCVGGIPEIIENSVNGILVPPDEPEILAEKITWLLRNKNIMRQMGLHAKQIVQKKFNITNTIKKLETLYLNSIDYKITHWNIREVK